MLKLLVCVALCVAVCALPVAVAPEKELNFDGNWLAFYPGQDLLAERLDLVQQGAGNLQLIGTKVTGDKKVPAGQVSFVITLDYSQEQHVSGLGRVLTADTGFTNPEWHNCTFSACLGCHIHIVYGDQSVVLYRESGGPEELENTIVDVDASYYHGEWLAFYPDQDLAAERVSVKADSKGHHVIGTKVTGDTAVPAGKVSFELSLDPSPAGSGPGPHDPVTGHGRIVTAGDGYKSPRWHKAEMKAGLCRAVIASDAGRVALYREFHSPSMLPAGRNFSGQWSAYYPGMPKETVTITQSEDGQLVGTKVTGDVDVPAGEVSFVLTLFTTTTTTTTTASPIADGRIVTADKGFVDPLWHDAKMYSVFPWSFQVVSDAGTASFTKLF